MKQAIKQIIAGFLFPTLFVLVILIFMTYWQNIFGWFNIEFAKSTVELTNNIFKTMLYLNFAWFFSRGLDVFMWTMLLQHRIGTVVPRLLKDVVTTIIFFIAVVFIFGTIFQKSVTGLLAASGALGLVVGFAAKNVISDIFNGIAINLDKPFKIGDIVFLHDRTLNISAQVKEVTWRTTRFETDRNGLLVIPNDKISSMPITNLSYHKSINYEVTVVLDEDVPSERALRILNAAIRGNETILKDPAPKARISGFNELGIKYSISYWLQPTKISPGVGKHGVVQSIIHYLKKSDIGYALPKQTNLISRNPPKDYANPIGPRATLEHIEIFSKLTPDEFDIVTEHCTMHLVPEGETICEIDEEGDSMYVIAEGLLRVFIRIKGEKHLVGVATLGPRDFFGEMSLLTGQPRTATIKADTEVVIYKIPKEAMVKVLQQRPQLAEKISHVVAARQAANIKMDEEMKSVKDKQDHQKSLAANILDGMKKFFNF